MHVYMTKKFRPYHSRWKCRGSICVCVWKRRRSW